MPKKNLILASSSPRRQELLRQVQIPFTIRKLDTDESKVITKDPVLKVKQLAQLKGEHVDFQNEDEVILSADTVVSYKQQIFEKPKDQTDAYSMLSTLSGKEHEVYTGVMIRSTNEEKIIIEKTHVEFWSLTDEEITWYINTKDPYDKAGAYGIQSLGSILVKQIIGDYNNVVGLPLARVVRELRNFSIFPELME